MSKVRATSQHAGILAVQVLFDCNPGVDNKLCYILQYTIALITH